MLLNLMPRRFWETCSPASSSWSLTWPASTLLPLPQRVRQRGPFLCARDGGLHHVHTLSLLPGVTAALDMVFGVVGSWISFLPQSHS
jgi:hypothetical protein